MWLFTIFFWTLKKNSKRIPCQKLLAISRQIFWLQILLKNFNQNNQRPRSENFSYNIFPRDMILERKMVSRFGVKDIKKTQTGLTLQPYFNAVRLFFWL